MKNLFNSESFLMRFLSRVADMMLLNALWLICCIPVVTIGSATAAAYHVVLKIVEQEEAGIFKMFWQGFRSNFKQATKVYLILFVPMVIVILDIILLAFGLLGDGIAAKVICGFPALVFSMVWAYVFPLTAKFENTAFTTIKNALILSIANLPRTLAVTALNLFPLVWAIAEPILFTKCFVIFILGGFAWIAYGNAHILNKIFNKLIESMQPEKAE